MQMVGGQQGFISRRFARTVSDVQEIHVIFPGYIGCSFIVGIYLPRYLTAVPAFGKWRNAPVGNGKDEHIFLFTTGKTDGLLQQGRKFLHIGAGTSSAILIVYTYEQRHEIIT